MHKNGRLRHEYLTKSTITTQRRRHRMIRHPSRIYSPNGTVRKLWTRVVSLLHSSPRTNTSSRRAPLICILSCLTLPAEDFFESLLCCSSGVKVNGECVAVAGTQRQGKGLFKSMRGGRGARFTLQIDKYTT